MAGVVRRIANGGKTPTDVADVSHDIVIVGGGAAGISVASSLLRAIRPRHRHHRPADIHYYQPGWTMVGGGIFDRRNTAPRPWLR
jgi:sulfide:quinone oxidoreductase